VFSPSDAVALHMKPAPVARGLSERDRLTFFDTVFAPTDGGSPTGTGDIEHVR
jgi:hypothetical protein